MIGDYSAVALGAFVAGNVADGSTVVSDGWSGYAQAQGRQARPTAVGADAGALGPPGSTASSRTRSGGPWASTHGLREHLQAYLDEFVFRFNRLDTPAAAFERLLGLSLTLEAATYQVLVCRS